MVGNMSLYVPETMSIEQKEKINYARILGCALLNGFLVGLLCGVSGGLLSCIVDWDHIWVWVLLTVPPISLTSNLSRPFHTIPSFLTQSELWVRCNLALVRRFLLRLSLHFAPVPWLDNIASPLLWEEPLQEIVN